MRQIPQKRTRGRAPANRSFLFSPPPHLVLLLCAVFILPTAASALGDTFEKRVSHNDDDAEADAGGGMSTNNDKMEFGQMGWVGFRFRNVTIPQGATIINAYVEFKAADSSTESTDLTIFGQDADSTSQFDQSSNNLSNRPRTSASVDWSNVPHWSMNQSYQTPGVTTVIQEIVDRGGWSSGNAMVILVRSDDLDGKRLVVAHDDSSSNAALLHIEYSTGGGGGGVYYVRTTGSDANDGLTPASAFMTITKAESVVGAGDTVYVGAGTYVENEIIIDVSGSAGARIEFIADTAGAFTGDAGTVYVSDTGGDKDGIKVNGAAYVTVDGFHFTNSKDGLGWRGSDYGIISNCEMSNNSGHGLHLHDSILTVTNTYSHHNGKSGFRTCHGSTITLSDCESASNATYGHEADAVGASVFSEVHIHDNPLSGVYLKKQSNVTYINTLIVNNGNHGFHVWGGDNNPGVQLLTVWHCTVADNAGDGFNQEIGTGAITNSIFADNGGDGIELGGGALTHTYNLVYGNSGNAFNGTSASTGELTSDPLFVSAGDYQLQKASPPVNAGTDGSSATTIDLLGTARPVSGLWDMGCYEGGGGAALFVDVSTNTGFDAQTTTQQTHGSGFYWADYDDDGDLDAIITGSSAKLMLSNNAGQSFFVSSLGGLRRQGAMADLDNDGDIDFWAGNDNSYYAAACLLNNGSAAFSNIGNCGYSEPSSNEGVAAADVDGDGWCDIMQFSANGNWIGHNQGSTAIVLSGTDESSYGLNDSGDTGNGDYCSAGDVNNDGYLDFFYHYGDGKLFLSNGDGTYTQNNYGISVVTGENDKMGSAWGDYDNDGDLDLFVGRYASGQPGYLWRNDGGSFSDVASAAGITDASGQHGCCWGDYDNDGDLDLYIVTHSNNANVLYQNQGGGVFVAAAEGADASGNGHDAVFVDYDNDGDLDLAVSQQGEDNTLLANGTDNTNYLKVRVIGHGVAMTNKAAVGVRVELYEANETTFMARREIGVARGWAGAEPLWIHFGGLTNTTTYVVKVHFASGVEEVTVVPQNATTTIGSTVINQMLTVEEREPRIIRWTEVDPGGQ